MGRLNDQDQSLLSSLAAIGGVSILITLLFCYLRERVPRFFLARDKWQHVKKPCASGFFAWVRSCLEAKDDFLLDNYGLDIVMYQRWLYTVGMSFFIMFCISLVTLMPINIVGDNKYRSQNDSLSTRGFGILSMANIDSTGGQVKLLWAHFISVFFFSLIPILMLTRDWKYYSKASADMRALELPSNYTVMVNGLPPTIRMAGDPKMADRFLTDAYRPYLGDDVEYAHVAVYNPKLSLLVAEYKQIERDLEVAHHIWRTKTERMRVFCGKGPFRIWPPWKPRVDAIDWLTKRRDVVYQEVCKEQQSRQQEIVSLGFVKLKSQVKATMAGQLTLSKNRFRYRTSGAPDPRDVVWEHVHIGHVHRGIRKAVVYAIFIAMIIFWMIPVLFAASITNLTRLSRLGAFRWLRGLLNWKPALTRLIEGLLPVLIVNVSFLIALPIIRAIAGCIGLWRHSEAERTARNVLLFLLVWNVLLVYTISGTVFFNLDFFLDSSLTHIVDLLAQTIPQQAYYFTSYVMTNGFLGASLLLLRPHFCAAWLFLRYVWAKSPAQQHEADRPFIFEFDESYARASLCAIMTLTYATMFPIITMFGTFYFFLLYLSFRYNAQYVNVPRYEGFGRQFPFAYTAIIIGLSIYQLTMFGVLQLAGFWPAPALLALPIISWLMWRRTRMRYLKPVNVGALNTLKGKGLLVRMRTQMTLKDLKNDLEVDMNLSDSDISVARSRKTSAAMTRAPTATLLFTPYRKQETLQAPEGTASDGDLTVSRRKEKKGLRKDPYLQPERQPLKPPFDFATRSRSPSMVDVLADSMSPNYGLKSRVQERKEKRESKRYGSRIQGSAIGGSKIQGPIEQSGSKLHGVWEPNNIPRNGSSLHSGKGAKDGDVEMKEISLTEAHSGNPLAEDRSDDTDSDDSSSSSTTSESIDIDDSVDLEKAVGEAKSKERVDVPASLGKPDNQDSK